MEYLMTYGWAIVVVAVVIGVLFALGVFSPSTGGSTNSCIAISGFRCSGAVLTSSGILSMNIGQLISGPITVTSIGCTSNATAPTMQTLVPPVSLPASALVSENFSCFSGTQPLGTKFTGFIWIGYTPSGSSTSTVIRLGAVKATVTVASTGAPSSGRIAYVPINVINYNAISGTGTNFQQLINFTPSAYSSNEASNLGNIRFYQGGTELYSWCESGCSSSSSNANFWVLIPGGLASGASNPANRIQINMTFLSLGSGYDGVYAGECPTCSGATYAQYDNGASLFGFYDNFYGSTLSSSKWSTGGGSATVTVSNGLTISGSSTGIWLYGKISSNTQIFEAYISSATSGIMQVRAGYSLTQGQQTNYDSVSDFGYVGTNYQIESALAGLPVTNSNLPGGLTVPYIQSFAWTSSGYQTAWINYASQITGSTNTNLYSYSSSSYPTMLVTYATPGSYSTTMNWVRVRQYPPGGVMPSVTLGSISH